MVQLVKCRLDSAPSSPSAAPVMPEVKLFPVRPKVSAAQYRHADAPLHFTANSARYPAINAVFPHSRVVAVRTDKLAREGFRVELDDDYYRARKLSPDGKRVALTVPGTVCILTVADGAVENVGDQATRTTLFSTSEAFWDPHRPQALYLEGTFDPHETNGWGVWYEDLATEEIKLYMKGDTANIDAIFPNDILIFAVHNDVLTYYQIPLDQSLPPRKIDFKKAYGYFDAAPNMLYSAGNVNWPTISFYDIRKKRYMNISIENSIKKAHHRKKIDFSDISVNYWLPDSSGILNGFRDHKYTDLVKVLRNGKVTVYGTRVKVLSNSYNGKHWLVKAGKNYYVVSVR